MNLSSRILLAGCVCIALLSCSTSAAFGQTEACCLPNGTCQNATVLSCTVDLGGTPSGAGSVCLGDDNGDGFDDLCVSPVIISEYYESTPGTRKCIELFNPGSLPFDLGAHGYRIAAYTVQGTVTDRLAGSRGVYTFGTLQNDTVPSGLAGSTFLICAVDNADGYAIDLLLPFTCAPCGYTGGGNSPIAAYNGDDEVVLFGPDISAPLDNVVDVFGVPGQGDSGPRGTDPYIDAAWERKFSVTNGVRDFLGFDPCNFDGLKAGLTVPTPPGTPVGEPCLSALDISSSNQWIFEGLNPSGNNQNHTLGSHIADTAPLATNVRAITKIDTPVALTLSVNDIDGDPFNVIVDSVPATGTIFDGATEIGTIADPVPYTMSDPLNPLITFVPDAGVGTDASFTYHGEQIAPPQIGNTATASILVEDEGVLITEVMYNPNSPVISPESQWEWVEIINTTAGTVTLGEINSTNCPICGENLITDPGGAATPTSIDPGEILVIVGNITTTVPRTDQEFLDLWGLTASQVLFVDSTGGDFPFLTQGGTELFLKDETGDLIDFVPNYGNAPFPADVPGSSIYLTDTALDNNDGANWASAVVDCAAGFREVSDSSIGSPSAVPGAPASILLPCATSLLEFTVAGSPTSKTVTLQGTLPGGGAASFKITSLSVLLNGFDDQLGTLFDGPDNSGTNINGQALPYTVTDPMGRVTLEEANGKRHFYQFEFLAFDSGSGDESPPATATIAVQGSSVVITEIMANPVNTGAGNETYWEYLEVTNTSGSPVTLSSMQGTNGPVAHDFNLETGTVPNVTIPAGTTRLIARDALDHPPGSVRTRAEFEAEWSTGGVGSTDVIYVPNATGGNEWDGMTNAPLAPGRFVTIWDNPNDFEATGLLDVVVYRIGQDGWPANSQPNSIFYRGDSNGAPFTTLGNDSAVNWQESTPGCTGDASFDSFVDIIGGDTTADHGSPLALPTDPDECVPVTCGTCLGDLSGDSKVDGNDIQSFIDAVVAPGFPLIGCADMNGDGNALDYLPDVPLFVDALVFGNTDCPVTTTHSTEITINLTGAPVAGDVELFIGGCDPALPCDTLKASPPFICFERVTVSPATTAADLALALAFGADGTKDAIGGLDEFCAAGGADVNVAGPTISIVFTRDAGLPVPCCYVQDTDGRFSIIAPFDFVEVGGAGNCVVTNLLNGTPGDEGAAQTSGFSFTKTGD